jgi:hypothetical protein
MGPLPGRGRGVGRGSGRSSRRVPGEEEDEGDNSSSLEDKGFSNGKTILVLAIVVSRKRLISVLKNKFDYKMNS